jgi:hypothetical protein
MLRSDHHLRILVPGQGWLFAAWPGQQEDEAQVLAATLKAIPG